MLTRSVAFKPLGFPLDASPGAISAFESSLRSSMVKLESEEALTEPDKGVDVAESTCTFLFGFKSNDMAVKFKFKLL